MGPSNKAVQREKDRPTEMTDRRQGCTPITQPIERLNRQLEGWANHFWLGYTMTRTGKINWHRGSRLANHFQHHSSQRPFQPHAGTSLYAHLQRLGLEFLIPKSRAH